MDIGMLLVSFILLFGISLTALYIWSIVWSFQDAAKRGKNTYAVALLTALFAWPFGLLFWTIIRPETIKHKKLASSKKSNRFMLSFREMPFLLKVLFLISIVSMITVIGDFIQMKPIDFEYFGSGFPKNAPYILYVYNLLFNVFTILVYFKRSYSALKQYIYFSLGVMILSLCNSIYFVVNLPSEQRFFSSIVYIIGYTFYVLILMYHMRLKKYFNRE